MTRIILSLRLNSLYLAFSGKYDLDSYLEWELVVDQKFACHAFLAQHQVRAATSEFSHFASIWWCGHL
jgi:hypothetical protein